jgi:hypothetical protein
VQTEQRQAGTPALLASVDGQAVTVTLPGGESRSFAGTGQPLEFTETSRAGFYRVQGGGQAREFAVNVASAGESDIEPRFETPAERDAADAAAGDAAAGPAEARAGARVPLWGPFALAGFLLAAAAWAAWLREAAAARPRPGQ